MLDLKVLRSALEQLEEEKKIPKEKIIDAIEQALAAAYKKDYGKKHQIIRAHFDMDTGTTDFSQVKVVVDKTMVRTEEEEETEGDERALFNEEHDIWIDDAQKMKKGAALGDELTFPLESKDDYGRIAAQTAKQVIIQRIREAEKSSVIEEFEGKEGSVVSGTVQRVERGNVLIDLGRTTAILPYEEQIPGERYYTGNRIRAYLYKVEEGLRGISIRLSRTHPKLIEELFKSESPEIAGGTVEIKSIAREPGSRSKIAVMSHDSHVDPVGACVGQRGVRVSTVMNELNGEKIDIIEWSADTKKFVSEALSPAKVLEITINEEERTAHIVVSEEEQSLAIGKGGQNVRLAARLTGFRIDIGSQGGATVAESDGEKTTLDKEVEEELQSSDSE